MRKVLVVISLAASGVMISACSTIYDLTTAPVVTLAPGASAPTTTLVVATTTQPTIPPTEPCMTFMIKIREVYRVVRARTTELSFSVKNVSGIQCTLFGTFTVNWRGETGKFLPTHEIKGGPLSYEHPTTSPVTLAKNAVAYFNIGVDDTSIGSAPCTVAPRATIGPANKSLKQWVTLVPPVRACDDGVVHISKVFSRTDMQARQTMAGPFGASDAGREVERG